MYPEKIGNLFTLYGLLIGIGLLLAFLVIWKLAKIGKVEDKFVDFASIALVVSVAVGFVFAMLFQSLYNWIAALKIDPNAQFEIDKSMTFIGGLIGGVVCFLPIYFIFRKKFQGRFVDIISILPIALTLAHAFGRFGCFTAGCCYGTEATGPFAFLGVRFPAGHLTGGALVWPTQLFEAFFLLVITAIMAILYIKKRFPHNMSIYLITYGIFRFLIEYIRGDERGDLVTGVSPSQFLSIFMVVIGIALWLLMAPVFKKRRLYLAEHPIIEPELQPSKGKKSKVAASCATTGIDTAEDGFKLDEKSFAVESIELLLPKDYELRDSVVNPPTPVATIHEKPPVKKEAIDKAAIAADEERASNTGKIGEFAAEDGFTVGVKVSMREAIERQILENKEIASEYNKTPTAAKKAPAKTPTATTKPAATVKKTPATTEKPATPATITKPAAEVKKAPGVNKTPATTVKPAAEVKKAPVAAKPAAAVKKTPATTKPAAAVKKAPAKKSANPHAPKKD